MKLLKKSLIFASIFLCSYLQAENFESTIDAFSEKIKTLEQIVMNLTKVVQQQQETLLLLQRQLQTPVEEIEEEEDEDDDCGGDDDHRLTLRIPKTLMAKVDLKRKQRIGKISRNLWILETLDKATKK